MYRHGHAAVTLRVDTRKPSGPGEIHPHPALAALSRLLGALEPNIDPREERKGQEIQLSLGSEHIRSDPVLQFPAQPKVLVSLELCGRVGSPGWRVVKRGRSPSLCV